MPKLRQHDERGDLYAHLEVTLPQQLTDEETELFAQLREMREGTGDD